MGGCEVKNLNVQTNLTPIKLCASCGKEVVDPIPPPEGKKLLCLECFSKIEISKEGR
jgi:CxxC-x17-CxxC domain-containing protein